MDNEKKKRLAELRDSMKSYGYMDGVEELEDIFPEIKENEDEGIRKFIIDCIDELRKANAENADFNGCCSEAIAYLEEHKEPTWTAEDESFVKHILPRILNPDKWTLDQISADKRQLTAFIERQKRKYAKEQQPAEWSEEDEKMIERLIRHTQEEYNELCNDRYGHQEIVSDLKKSCRERMNWLENRLKSLRPQPKRELYEEDNVIKNVISYLNGEYGFKTHDDEDAYRRGLVRQLKSLQPHWKPSEEQMRAVFDASERNDKLGSVLRNLYDDLKKL